MTPPTLDADQRQRIFTPLLAAQRDFTQAYPGERGHRQPVHTVYGGAHLFKHDTARRLGQQALKHLHAYAGDAMAFAGCLKLQGATAMAQKLYERVAHKLAHDAVEDFRLDFEDGYGHRSDAEEDAHAHSAALQVAEGFEKSCLPPFIGLRIKPLTEALCERSVRTLDIFVSTLTAATRGILPHHFVITLPKVTTPEQVAALVRVCGILETQRQLAQGSLKLEIMVETTQAIIGPLGSTPLVALIQAAEGRCVGAHFGAYDYTASCNITAAHQSITHPACDFARHVMQVALSGTGVALSDGATHMIPVGPHRSAQPLTPEQERENLEAVHRGWRLNYQHVRRSLAHGYYQGWDLHASQLPVRYAAVYAFFLEGLEAASTRLNAFLDSAARATLSGDIFDDAATGQGLLNFFLRGLSCGALTQTEVQASGLTQQELNTRSFLLILQGRRLGAAGASP